MIRRERKKYYFTVEGQTEKLYLEWLKNAINSEERTEENVSFQIKVEPNPLSYAKNVSMTGTTNVTHIVDMESNSEEHTEKFYNLLNNLDKANKLKNVGRQVTYNLAYSNYTFELWMILHKKDCLSTKSHRKEYLKEINSSYKTAIISLNDYKEEANFKKLLESLTLNDVKQAVLRSEEIMKKRQECGDKLMEYRSYKFYKNNPSLSIGEVIKTILQGCGLYEKLEVKKNKK